jgi:hypothetical protein
LRGGDSRTPLVLDRAHDVVEWQAGIERRNQAARSNDGVIDRDVDSLATGRRHRMPGITQEHRVQSEIHGDYAFPMVSRGRVLVLGRKRSDEAYAPDELEVVLRLAHTVGSTLDVLAHDGAGDAMLEQLRVIRETQTAMCEALAALCGAHREIREALAALPAAIGDGPWSQNEMTYRPLRGE